MATVKINFVDKVTGKRYAAGMPYDGNREPELTAKGYLSGEQVKDDLAEPVTQARKPKGRRRKANI